MNYRSLFFALLLPVFSCTQNGNPIVDSDDLRETGPLQRRDLSTVGSRIVLNTYDFGMPASKTASVYSNSDVLPLNVGYLTTECTDRQERGRFGREYKNVLEIRLAGNMKVPCGASEYSTEWLPYCLPFSAGYPDGTILEGFDTFSSDSVVVRSIRASAPVSLRVSGAIKGNVSAVTENALLMDGNDCRYAVSVRGHDMSEVKFYLSADDMLNGIECSGYDNAGYWSIDTEENECFDISVAFVLPGVADGILADAVSAPYRDEDSGDILMRQKAYWDYFLSEKVPHPSRFDLNSIDMKGVTSEEVMKLYYKAWVALAQNVLKPETSAHPYWQVTAGKSSLWDEGHPTLPFSAAWESFVGLQLFGYIDIDIAWSSLKGLLSLVDDKGMLGGESLPSRKAHSAWILYQLSGDKASLAEVYPAIERYLNWRLTQPRWIYGNATPETEKDAEFVVSVMVDMEYMSRIAEVLGRENDAREWLAKREDYISNYTGWFWETPQSIPVQFFNNYPHRGGFPIQVTSGLVLPELEGDYLDGMMKLFYSNYDPDKTFAGFAAPKYPDMDFTIYGLIAKGRQEEAKIMLETFIRDVARTGGVFAETYFDKEGMPDPSGVRPSIFGLAGVIDFIWLRNNYMFTQGTPVALNLYDEDTSVSGLTVRGKKLEAVKKTGKEAFIR